MPLRASSHPGSPNSPSCSALAWYSCWSGLSPWGESGNRTPAARTAALIRYRYATQPTHDLGNGWPVIVNPLWREQCCPTTSLALIWKKISTKYGTTFVQIMCKYIHIKADSRFVPSQWEAALLWNDISHWLGANLESALQWTYQLERCWSCKTHSKRSGSLYHNAAPDAMGIYIHIYQCSSFGLDDWLS